MTLMACSFVVFFLVPQDLVTFRESTIFVIESNDSDRKEYSFVDSGIRD
jgi:hypothetical protein